MRWWSFSLVAGAAALSSFQKLQGIGVHRAIAPFERVELTSLWQGDERCELAATLQREALPKLRAGGVKLLCVGIAQSIGTPERGAEFSAHVGLDPEVLFTDPENAAYDALDLIKDVKNLAFNEATPFAILDRIKSDNLGDLATALSRWKPWIPPKLSQGLQQGGVLVFDGEQTLYERKDPSTGAHAPLDLVLEYALAPIHV
ncbi:hypothetical protein CTAYLR_007763 [Chrysophaeum taylorii]|uniref:Uncharacterized protein n=1 Tax=Chrysophaeum taylorii TaxID=2483200 RepID=A0AAD7UKL2_9STRA|nr:hypothetical protein CTAYLR_007763 [Chrysophaeum taylorii]